MKGLLSKKNTNRGSSIQIWNIMKSDTFTLKTNLHCIINWGSVLTDALHSGCSNGFIKAASLKFFKAILQAKIFKHDLVSSIIQKNKSLCFILRVETRLLNLKHTDVVAKVIQGDLH